MKYKHTLSSLLAAAPWAGYEWLSWSFESAMLFYGFLILQAVLVQEHDNDSESDTEGNK